MRRSLWLALLLAAPLEAQDRRSHLTVVVLDVGQASAALVETPDSQWILLDAGRTDGHLADWLARRRNISRFAVIVGSHRHEDHIGGVADILQRWPVELYVGDTSRTEDRANRTTMLRRRIQQQRVRVQSPGADTLTVGGVRLVLLPAPPFDDSNENNNSIVVRLEYRGFSMLFPGDAELEEQHWLQAFYPELLESDVLVAAHHGAMNGETADWLDLVRPTAVIISAGAGNTYGHPTPGAVEDYDAATGGEVYCTNRQGNVRLVVQPDGRFDFNTEREARESCGFEGR